MLKFSYQKKIKKYWLFRHPVKTLLIILGSFLCGVLALSYLMTAALLPKTCDDWHKGMTREEKILLAVQIVNDTGYARVRMFSESANDYYYSGTAKLIPYATAEEILKEQPDCCKLYNGAAMHTETPSEVLSGEDEGIVHVGYMGRLVDRSGKMMTVPVSVYVNFNYCR